MVDPQIYAFPFSDICGDSGFFSDILPELSTACGVGEDSSGSNVTPVVRYETTRAWPWANASPSFSSLKEAMFILLRLHWTHY